METAGLLHLLITRSEEGMSLFTRHGEAVHIPTVAREVFDVSGAGDTVLSALGVGIASGLSMAEAARLANSAAGIAVGKLGTSTVSPEEIIAAVALAHSDSESKIKNRDVLATIIEAEKKKGKRIVFTNGCFDLLHAGHVRYLNEARALGEVLVVGLNADSGVRRLKGPGRPVLPESERAEILAALAAVDAVVLFSEDTPLTLVEALSPDVLVKGGDWKVEDIVGGDHVRSKGGRVLSLPTRPGRSTSALLGRLRGETP
jgi:D-beta-D-heptose 7-phosphate kinase/D-beta-D-heptose 1-phosphate adenosyltransferase